MSTFLYSTSSSVSCSGALYNTSYSICEAVALAAVEHSPLCQANSLCPQVGEMTRNSISYLYAVNLMDLVLEVFSIGPLLLCIFTPKFKDQKYNGRRVGSHLLFVMLFTDIILEILSISTASQIYPTVKVLKESSCLDRLQTDGRTLQETLVKLESDLESIVALGIIELLTGVVAAAGDLKEIYDEIYGLKRLTVLQRITFLFVPAGIDLLLAVLDFSIFTTSAAADNAQIRKTIINHRQNRTAVWCVTVQDACLPIVEEDAARLGASRPGEVSYTGLIVLFSFAVPLLSLLYMWSCHKLCDSFRVNSSVNNNDVEVTMTAPTEHLPVASTAGNGPYHRRYTDHITAEINMTTAWEDIRPERSYLEELLYNEKIAEECTRIREIAHAVESKAAELRSNDEARPLINLIGSTDGLHAIVAYTYDLRLPGGSKKGNLYFEMNQQLRNRTWAGDAHVMATWGVCVHITLKALAPLPDFQGTCYRGFPAEDRPLIMRKYKKRRPIQWGAFTSVTTDVATARRFAGAGGVVIKIDVGTGKNICALSYFPTEAEVLLSPNHKYTVTSETGGYVDEERYTTIEMMQLEGEWFNS